MKCNVCGFKYNGPESKCPYCGNYSNKEKSFFYSKRINFFDIVELNFLQLITLILVNIYIFIVAINLIFIKQSGLYVYAAICCAAVYTVLKIISSKKDLISILRKIDFFMTVSLAIWLIFIYNSKYIAEYVIPVYVVVMLCAETIGMLFNKKIKLSRCYLSTVWHLMQITLPFIFLQVGLFGLQKQSVGGYLIIISFIVSVFFLTNNTILLFLSLNSKVREWLK